MKTILLCCCSLFLLPAFAQVKYTANGKVIPADQEFGIGTNIGYYEGWNLRQLADIAFGNAAVGQEGIGVNTTRQALFEHFQEQWGYDFRVATFEHFKKNGATEHTIFVGYPSEAHRDKNQYCKGTPTPMFKNMYEPIWDDGENGTPYNDENYYAAYLYKTVSIYKDYVNYWQVMNEPDQTSSRNSNYARGQARNWWENNPTPCECAIKAPIFHYVRMLRISWEVIKTVDPTAYVTIGGIGYPSFLDAVLRNTDNPEDGSASADYPLKGGAYFDVLSYHSYPHLDGSLREWNNAKGDFDYTRNTDAAVAGVFELKKRFEKVLKERGYDGKQYPAKEWIITECNVPKTPINGGFGSPEVQRNFIIKVLVEAQKQGIRQFHIFNLADRMELEKATTAYSEFQVMGLYQNMFPEPFQQQPTELGIAYRTTANLLKGFELDVALTEKLAAFPDVDGGAFKNKQGEQLFILWAKTGGDQSEKAKATINLEQFLARKQVLKRTWNYSQTKASDLLSVKNIPLDGSPIVLSAEGRSAKGMDRRN